MITIKDIINFTETFAPLNTQMEFDNSGLLIGSDTTKVTKALVALDITPEVVKEAVEKQCELIISHHPVIFAPLKNISCESVVYKLIENSLSALCLHTNLDLSPEFGVNTCLANAVNVKNGMFVSDKCLFIGKLEKEISIDEFALAVKENLNCEGVRYTKAKKQIKTVAICSGSGGDYVSLAKEKGADVLLTGEIKHHEILLANSLELAVVDGSHFKTEDVVIGPLCNKLQSKFNDVEFIKSEIHSDKLKFI